MGNTIVSIKMSPKDVESLNQVIAESGAMNRSDFIRQAIREKVARTQEAA